MLPKNTQISQFSRIKIRFYPLFRSFYMLPEKIIEVEVKSPKPHFKDLLKFLF